MPNKKRGCHTFAITLGCSYTEIQNILSDQVYIRRKHDKFFLNVSYDEYPGVEFLVKG